MGWLTSPVDEPRKPSKSPGNHPHAVSDYRVKGRRVEHGRHGGWDYTVESRGCLWVTLAAGSAALTALAGTAGAVARAKGWA